MAKNILMDRAKFHTALKLSYSKSYKEFKEITNLSERTYYRLRRCKNFEDYAQLLQRETDRRLTPRNGEVLLKAEYKPKRCWLWRLFHRSGK